MMRMSKTIAFGAGCFLVGMFAHAAMAQGKRAVFTPDLFQGKDPKVAAEALLDGAMQLAEDGSWERIAVGRAWYLGGDKAKGQQILDAVTTSKRVVASDWFRVGRIHAEAGEWEKAKAAFEKAMAADPGDDSGALEYGALANVNGDRAKAEEMFAKSLKKKPREFWHWVNAGGSYLGVKPQ